MQKKHIVVVTTNFANGGTERRASVLANEFLGKGYKVTYLVMNKIYPDVVYKLSGDISLVSISDFMESDIAKKEKQQAENWKDKKLKYLSKIHRIAKLFGINDVRVKSQKNILTKLEYLRAFALYNPSAIYICFGIDIYERVCFATEGLDKKLIYTDASAPDFKDDKDRYTYFKKVQSKTLKKADLCVFQTSAQKEYYGSCVKNNGIIIKNPLATVLPEMFIGERQKIIVNFCRTHPVKNLILLVDAFKRFGDEFTDYKLHIYGATCTAISEEYKNNVIKRIRDLGISEKVEFFEAIPNVHEKIVDYSMYVSSSDSEGLSNSMIEAMAMGLPCVCTDCLGGGAREMIADGENGLLVPVKDADAMYRAMCRMVQEEGLAQRCSENAYKVRTELSVENIVNQWINAIESL